MYLKLQEKASVIKLVEQMHAQSTSSAEAMTTVLFCDASYVEPDQLKRELAPTLVSERGRQAHHVQKDVEW